MTPTQQGHLASAASTRQKAEEEDKNEEFTEVTSFSDPVTPLRMSGRESDDEESDNEPLIKGSLKMTEHEMEVLQTTTYLKEEEERLGRMIELRDINQRARRVVRQQEEMALDHVCDELLDMGPVSIARTPFTAWLQSQKIVSLVTVFMYNEASFKASGFDVTPVLMQQLNAIQRWYHETHPTNRFLKIMGFTKDDLAKYMMPLTSILKKPPSSTDPMTESTAEPGLNAEDVPIAGPQSRAAKLREARRSSLGVSFNPNVTSHTYVRASRGSFGGDPNATEPQDATQTNHPPAPMTPMAIPRGNTGGGGPPSANQGGGGPPTGGGSIPPAHPASTPGGGGGNPGGGSGTAASGGGGSNPPVVNVVFPEA